jgi:DNA-binding transcriptional regulator YhcF (GntR family)
MIGDEKLFIKIDMHSSVPIYKQLKTAIISGILSGELKEGDRLPSVRQLGCDLGINLHTVNKVYNLLKDEGYIIINRSQGTIISKPSKANKEDLEEFENALLPIIIEMRAKNITREQFDGIIDSVWKQYVIGGDNK